MTMMILNRVVIEIHNHGQLMSVFFSPNPTQIPNGSTTTTS